MPRKTPEDALMAAAGLKTSMDFAARTRWRVRTLLDGGVPAVRALLGATMDDEDVELEDVPWANWLDAGLKKMALKIGNYPKVRADAPDHTDDEAPRKRAEMKERAVRGYDRMDRMEMQLPQVGRWLPGYGYAVWTIGARTNPEGVPYPKATLRDPYDCFVGEWGVEQQPSELAVHRVLPIKKAKELYGDIGGLDELEANQLARIPGSGGGVLLGSTAGSWANQLGRGVQVVEYYDDEGIHILMPALHARIDFIPNPLDSGPQFVVAKRFAFNQLIGQYNHTIGLMASGAKINALSIIAMEDAVFSETNVSGQLAQGKPYQKGRNAVNVLTPGSRVDKPTSNLPYQMFETINVIERQFRNTASYPIQDDANSPLSFATGAGLDELASTPTLEVMEYHRVIRHALQDVDAKRLEWDEKVSPDRRKPIGGKLSTIPRVETYKPAEFRGDYETRREHGLMAGWDDSSKIVGGLQMLEAEVLDVVTFQENIDGFDNITQMNERIADKKNREMLHQILLMAAQNNDLRAVAIMIDTLPESEFKEKLKKYFTPEEPQMSPEEEAFMASGGQPGNQDPMADLFASGDPAVQTVLSRLTQGGATQGGVQTVGRL